MDPDIAGTRPLVVPTALAPPEARVAGRDMTCAEIDALMAELGAAVPGPPRARLRERVITALMPLARRLCARFRGYGDEADLVQVAYLGLIKAVDGYDSGRGHAFLSYAVPTVRGELSRYARDHAALVRLPRAVQEARGRVRAARAELEQESPGAAATVAALAARTGLPEAEVEAALVSEEHGRPLSLDAPALARSETMTLGDSVGAEDPRLELAVDLVALRPVLAALPSRDRQILHLRFYEELTQQQIAERIGVSQMQVSRLLRACLLRLRRALEGGPAPYPEHSAAAGGERPRRRRAPAAAAREAAPAAAEEPEADACAGRDRAGAGPALPAERGGSPEPGTWPLPAAPAVPCPAPGGAARRAPPGAHGTRYAGHGAVKGRQRDAGEHAVVARGPRRPPGAARVRPARRRGAGHPGGPARRLRLDVRAALGLAGRLRQPDRRWRLLHRHPGRTLCLGRRVRAELAHLAQPLGDRPGDRGVPGGAGLPRRPAPRDRAAPGHQGGEPRPARRPARRARRVRRRPLARPAP
jgi:RNA polymerase sigma-70 factor (sigma-B/F/G subfamily)